MYNDSSSLVADWALSTGMDTLSSSSEVCQSDISTLKISDLTPNCCSAKPEDPSCKQTIENTMNQMDNSDACNDRVCSVDSGLELGSAGDDLNESTQNIELEGHSSPKHVLVSFITRLFNTAAYKPKSLLANKKSLLMILLLPVLKIVSIVVGPTGYCFFISYWNQLICLC